jgi:hypothetical protein
MESLNAFGSVASLIGLVISFVTLYKVTSLPAALKQHSRHQQYTTLIESVFKLPKSKEVIPDSTARDLENFIKTVRLFDVSRNPFRDDKLEKLLADLESEVKNKRQLTVVKEQLRVIRDEITIR